MSQFTTPLPDPLSIELVEALSKCFTLNLLQDAWSANYQSHEWQVILYHAKERRRVQEQLEKEQNGQ